MYADPEIYEGRRKGVPMGRVGPGEDIAAHGRYLSRDLCLAYINALAAGDPDATIAL
jgi:hypothetical protein